MPNRPGFVDVEVDGPDRTSKPGKSSGQEGRPRNWEKVEELVENDREGTGRISEDVSEYLPDGQMTEREAHK